jgi:hypothetical protein
MSALDTSLRISSPGSPDDLARLRAWMAPSGTAAEGILEQHMARPRYRPSFTRIAERGGQIAGYALIGHQRLRLGAARLEAGRITALDAGSSQDDPNLFAALLGDCLRVLVEEGLPLLLVRGPTEAYAPFGLAPYCLDAATQLASRAAPKQGLPQLRRATEGDLDDLAALHDATHHGLPLTASYTSPDWRFRLAGDEQILAIEDNRGRLSAFCAIDPEKDLLTVSEAAAADAGAARALCGALQAHAHAQGQQALQIALSPWHIVAQAALQLHGQARLSAPADGVDRPGQAEIAGVVDLPLLLEALVPEFEQRLARSRYSGWSGNLRMEIDTERITLAFAEGRATMIDGSRPADLRLRQVSLAALVQLCLGYRAAADLRATGGLACDDSALGLLDALFPTLLAAGQGVS